MSDRRNDEVINKQTNEHYKDNRRNEALNVSIQKTGKTPSDVFLITFQYICSGKILSFILMAILAYLVFILIFKAAAPHLFGSHTSKYHTMMTLVPSNVVWVDSQIKVPSGHSVSIKPTGAINLALHRVVEGAQKDLPPPYKWSTHEGISLPEDKPLYVRRKKLLIHEQAKIGALLMHPKPLNQGELEPSEYNPRPDNIIVLHKKETIYSNTNEHDVILYFTVNEKIFANTPAAKKAFVGESQELVNLTYGYKDKNKTIPAVKQSDLEYRWNNLVNTNYTNVWFDDNIGQFLVSIEMHEDKSKSLPELVFNFLFSWIR